MHLAADVLAQAKLQRARLWGVKLGLSGIPPKCDPAAVAGQVSQPRAFPQAGTPCEQRVVDHRVRPLRETRQSRSDSASRRGNLSTSRWPGVA